MTWHRSTDVFPTFSRRLFIRGAAGTALLAACASQRPVTFVVATAPVPASGRTAPQRFVVDAHCHIFSARDIDVDAFLRGLVRAYELPRPLRVSVEAITRSVQRILFGLDERLNAPGVQAAVNVLPFDKWPQLRPLRSVLTVLRMGGPPSQHFDTLTQSYPQVRLFLPAMVDFTHWTKPQNGVPKPTPFAEQLQAMEALAKSVNVGGKAPRMLPLVAFNPLREIKEGGHLALVKSAILEHGFVGIKIYPPAGFAPTNNATDPALEERITYKLKTRPLGEVLDEVLEELYAFCVAEDVPIMAHANNSNAMRRGAGFLASPWGWHEVLSDHPSLRLNLAHFGHVEGASTTDGASSSRCVSWAKHIVWLFNEYDNVYSDIGYSGLMNDTSDFHATYLAYMKDLVESDSKKRIPYRLMYGSDWWMSLLESMPDDYFANVQKWLGDHYPGWTRIWGDNALQYVGLGQADNKNAARIERLWGHWWTTGDEQL